jgi:hypothetical protein
MDRAIKVVIPVLLVALLFVCSPICFSQDKLASFFDPDETTALAPEVTDALKLICPQGDISRDQQGRITGCRHCPRQTTEWDAEDLDWDLKRTFNGHFTARNENNLILSGRGCEPHSGNFGGTFVFAVTDSVVRLLRYDKAVITERCRRLTVMTAPDILVCTDDWGAQVTLWSYVYAVEFRPDGKSIVKHIFGTIDKSQQKCGIDFFDDSPTSVQESHITALDVSNSKGRPSNLFITASIGEKTPTDVERKACQQGTPIPLRINSYRLDFFFDGSTFRPSEKSNATLKLFPKGESPEESYSPNH